MILFLDTEFTDFIQCELISISLVSEDGRHEFYGELTDFNLKLRSDFVREVVLPRLGKPLNISGGQFDTAGLEMALRAWLERLHDLDSSLLLLYDYKTDFDLLADALDGELPPWIEGHNINGQIGNIGWADGEYLNAHHALWDARALRQGWIDTQQAGAFSKWRPLG